MATEVLELVVRVTGGQQAAGEIDKVTKSANALTDSLRFMRNVLVAFSFARILEGVTSAVSGFQQINNLMRTITDNQEQANTATAVAAQIAVDTRSSFEGTAKLLYNIAASTKSMNLDWAEVVRLTTTFNQSTTLSGLDPTAAKNSMKDFIELLNLGIVQGRQFRALLIQDRPLVDAIATTIRATGQGAEAVNKILDAARADGKNVSGGTLYELAMKFKGAFTSEDMVRAIDTQTQISTNFDKMSVTISQAFEILKTKLLVFVNTVAVGSTVFTAIAESIRYVANNLEGLSEIALAVASVFIVQYLAIPLALWFYGIAESMVVAGAAAAGWAIEMAAAGIAATAAFALSLPATIASVIATAGAAIIELDALLGAAMFTIATTLISTVSAVWLAISGAAIEPLLALFGLTATSVAALGASLIALLPAVLSFTAVFATLGIVVGGLGAALIGFLEPLAQLGVFKNLITDNLGGPFKDVSITLKDIPALFSSAVSTIIEQWPLVTDLVGAIWTDMLNGMRNAWSNYWVDIRNMAEHAGNTLFLGLPDYLAKLGHPHAVTTQPYGPQLPTNTAGQPAKELSDKIAANYVSNQTKTPTLAGSPKDAGQIVTPEILPDLSKKIEAALKALADVLARFGGPQAKLNKDMEDFNAVLFRASQVLPETAIAAALAAAGFTDYNTKLHTSKMLQDAMIISVLGMKEGARDTAQYVAILNEGFARGIPALQEYGNQIKAIDVLITSLKERPTVGNGIQIAALEDQKRVSDQATIASSVASKYAYEQSDALFVLATSTQTLNQLQTQGIISSDKYAQGMRDIQLAALSLNTDTLSGLQRGLLDVQTSLDDMSKIAATTVVDAFNNMSDALTKFVVTGKLSLTSFFTTLETNLVKAALQAEVMKPLADSLSGILGSPGDGSSLGGIVSSALGSATGVQLGSSPFNPLYVSSVDASGLFPSSVGITPQIAGTGVGGGLGGLLGGGLSSLGNSLDLSVGGAGFGGGGPGLIADLGSFFGFASGGSFDVGGSGGVDSQPVMFKATPGEHVSVGQENNGGVQVIVNDMRTAQGSQPVETQTSQGSNGQQQITLLIRDVVNTNLASGAHDQALNANFGVSRAGTQR